MQEKQYKNYIFDLYGTLADIQTNEEDPALWTQLSTYLAMDGIRYSGEALRAKYYSAIRKLEDYAKSQSPDSQPEIDLALVFRSFYADAGIPVEDAVVAHIAKLFRLLSLRRLRLYPGVTELLTRLRKEGKFIYVLANAQALFTRPELQLLELMPYLDGILLSSEAGRKKPDPEFFHLLFRQYDLDPAECIMVGKDDRCDCHGAHAAGMDSLYIATEQSPLLTGPLPDNCRRIQDIREVAHTL